MCTDIKIFEFKKARKVPVEIDTFQLTNDIWENMKTNCVDGSIFINNYLLQIGLDGETQEKIFFIDTLENADHLFKAKLNDWLIKGVDGEIYACKPEIFEKTYNLNSKNELIINDSLKHLLSKNSILEQLGHCVKVSESIALPLQDIEDFETEDFEKINEIWAFITELGESQEYKIPEYQG